jgi:4-amino-4-deoxy-L-arabinose transferase-like glycosyltransferase
LSVPQTRTSPTRTVICLALLAAVCAAANLTKPVQIDDAAYLAIANWVAGHPLHPMLGLVNWGDTAQPISALNQPLLFIYLQALVQVLWGPSLLAQHALMALVSAGVVLVFYRLARATGAQPPLLLTALLVLGPAFLPGQNLMMDVPALLCWLICFWALLSADGRPTGLRLMAGAMALAAGLLIKYTSLVLLPIFAITLLRRRQWRQLWVLAIPLGALAGWSIFNLWDYGGIHVLTRSVGEVSLGRYLSEFASWVAGLGAVAPFTVMFVRRLPARRWLLPALGLIAAATWLTLAYRTNSLLLGLAWAVLIGNGCVVLALAGGAALQGAGSVR